MIKFRISEMKYAAAMRNTQDAEGEGEEEKSERTVFQRVATHLRYGEIFLYHRTISAD
jgi:hypothetical protein